MKLYNKLPALLFVLLLFSCGGNESHGEEGDDTTTEISPVEISTAIVGDWQLEELTRSNKPVPFEDFSLSYAADSTFTSNLFDGAMEKPFENGLKAILEGSNIYFNEVTISYYVESISDTSLVLSTEMNDFPFEFTFKKAN